MFLLTDGLTYSSVDVFLLPFPILRLYICFSSLFLPLLFFYTSGTERAFGCRVIRTQMPNCVRRALPAKKEKKENKSKEQSAITRRKPRPRRPPFHNSGGGFFTPRRRLRLPQIIACVFRQIGSHRTNPAGLREHATLAGRPAVRKKEKFENDGAVKQSRTRKSPNV